MFLKKISFGYLAVFIFLVIGFILYADSFPNRMFWDDDDNILKNQYIQNWKYLPKFFSENQIAGAGFLSNQWRPMLLTIFSLEWHLFKDWPPGYHFVNTLFHIANAILLFFLLSYLFKNRLLAFLTASVFLVHPLQTEAVTYVSGLGDPLAAFFILLGILSYLKFRISAKTSLKSGWYFLSLIMYPLALMSKETAIIMPAFIFIADFFREKLNPVRNIISNGVKTVGKAIWPFFILAAFYLLVRGTVLNFNNIFNIYNEKNILTSNFYVRLFTFFRALTIYLRLLFWPLNLHMERTVEIATSFFSPLVISGAFIFLALLALAFSQIKRFPILSFGLFWFFLGLLPTSNLLVPVNALVAERWLYLPIIGISLILIWLGMLIAEKYRVQKILSGILIVFLIFLFVLTINRNKDWRDPVTFYNNILQYNQESLRVWNNLGMAYAEVKEYEKATTAYQKAIELDFEQKMAPPHHNLANTYQELGLIEKAIEEYKKAISIDEKFIFSYNNLAALYFEQKKYDESIAVLEKAIKIFPDNPQIRYNLTLIKKTKTQSY